MIKDSLVIIPTYNESENIRDIIKVVLSQGNEFEVLIVDDNSPDGTADMVNNLINDNKRIHLIRRKGKFGLGTAYLEGFRWALFRSYKFIYEMDADFSHNPSNLPIIRKILNEEDYDMVVGSRYKNGINVVNWPMSRLILSYLANIYAKKFTGIPISDVTSGFKGIRREVLESLDFTKINADGYGFQIEIHFYTFWNNFKICEIPIIFIDRRSGHSKMSKKIIWEAFWLVWRLFFLRLFRKI